MNDSIPEIKEMKLKLME